MIHYSPIVSSVTYCRPIMSYCRGRRLLVRQFIEYHLIRKQSDGTVYVHTLVELLSKIRRTTADAFLNLQIRKQLGLVSNFSC